MGNSSKRICVRQGIWTAPTTDRQTKMEQFIADITQEFKLNPESVAFATKMFETQMENGRKMYDGDEQQAFAFAVRVVRLMYEEEGDDEEVEDEEEGDMCAECDSLLGENTHIFCCTKEDGEEMVVCSTCWQSWEKDFRKEGWKCDEDEDWEPCEHEWDRKNAHAVTGGCPECAEEGDD